MALLFGITANVVHAQITDDPVVNRLCHSWKKATDKKPVNADLEFRFIVNKDSTLMQGLYPDGLILSHWELDKEKMIFIIKDDKTSASYKMKIVRLTSTELVLQELSEGSPMMIFEREENENFFKP